MAQTNNKKKPTATAKKKSPSGKKTVSKGEQLQIRERREKRRSLWDQIKPYLLLVGALFLIICYFNGSGKDPGLVTGAIYKFLCGLFGGAAFVIPAFLVFAGIAGLTDKEEDIFGIRFIFSVISALLVSVLLEVISPLNSFKFTEMYSRGYELKGGGVIGGLIGEASLACFKTAGSYVIVIALLILSVLLSVGITPKYVFVYFSYKIKESRANRESEPKKERRSAADSFKRPEEIYEAYSSVRTPSRSKNTEPVGYDETELEYEEEYSTVSGRRRKFDTDIPLDDFEEEPVPEDTENDAFNENESEEEKQEKLMRARYEDVMRRSRETKTKEELAAEKMLFDDGAETIVSPEKPMGAEETVLPEEISIEEPAFNMDKDDSDIIDRIADAYLGKGESDTPEKAKPLEIERSTVSEITKAQPAAAAPKPEYNYPPIELLSEDPGRKNDNVREELHENAQRLVSVLASFNVKTKIVGVSRGPTITRYELLPEAGTRVRSIANLVDDIALNLATGGVRIEAPIPGKAAVGIEVPNKSAETVYLRSLISTQAFAESKSRITTCLGKNVAGETIIMDIKKMPHLLIAGATGMGKSVCINCLLVSLLYKAKPDEVKLILIDPKKVEFGVYNGLPHLLVPVVSDPKKAAGSLTWAVNEMERRFGLIESVGVRDLEGFNEITKNDPEYEYLPQIVIVIDELADLMATAPDDVETSIARLAAKARAAGMHLVIGTQRPSVDVITGVIKANIPSRIAFTVASQVDSRTIIDKSGAENLIGRGDMLYNPVGSSKPMRVQGAFVSDSEVGSVVTFIKTHNAPEGTSYSDDVMKEIEAQAAMCGVKKGGAGAAAAAGSADGDGDPLMDRAMEVAFESGKISTSLLQRRLSVGYGRAAKIIDKMEQMGYVSAPEGQKPRELLITKQDYMELSVRESDDGE